MDNFIGELRVENDKRAFLAKQLSGPGAMRQAVVFVDAYFNRTHLLGPHAPSPVNERVARKGF
jgi:hypothetical protein